MASPPDTSHIDQSKKRVELHYTEDGQAWIRLSFNNGKKFMWSEPYKNTQHAKEEAYALSLSLGCSFMVKKGRP